MPDLLLFLLKAIGISLSGVLAPGAVTAATLAAGTRNRHAGALVAAGHGLVEFPLMLLIMAGLGVVLESMTAQIIIGLAGGAFLLVLGWPMLRRPGGASADGSAMAIRHPIRIGVVLSAGNPYFLLWWATVGLGLAVEARSFGVLAFGIFAVVHWLCDLVWLELLSLASHQGSKVFGPKSQSVVGRVCGAAMLVFGLSFIVTAISRLG